MKLGAKFRMKDLSNIQFKDLEGGLNKIQDDLSSIDYFSEPGIYIVATNPGTGKSTAIKRKIKDLEKGMILVNSHKIAESEYDMSGLKIWKGFTNHNHSFPLAKKLNACGVPISMICSRCNEKKNCNYYKQFNAKKAVAPYNYLGTSRLNRQNKWDGPFKFENLIIDEEIFKINRLELNEKEIEMAINQIEQYVESPILVNFINELHSMTLDLFQERYFVKLINIKKLAIKKALDECNNEITLIEDEINSINKLNPYNLRKFFYYKEIYTDIDFYPEPILYDVFDIARQGIPVVLLDATFDDDIFQVLFSRYCYEDEILSRSNLNYGEFSYKLNEMKTTIYKSNLKNPKVNIYRLNKDNRYYKKNFFQKNRISNEELKNLEVMINLLKRKYAVISIITTHPLMMELKKKDFIGNIIIEHYRNLKGLNKMKDSDAIILFGTPSINFKEELKNYNDIFLTDYTSDEFERLDYFKSKNRYFENGVQNEVEELIRKREKLEKSSPKEKREHYKKNSSKIYSIYSTVKKYPFEYFFKDKKREKKLLNEFEKQKDTGVIDSYTHYWPGNYINAKLDGLIYQALMRGRLYRREKIFPDIFMLCHVPDVVDREFSPVYYDWKETKRFFEEGFKGRYPLVLKKQIDSYNSNNVKDISKDLKIYVPNKRSLNTKFITAMKNNDYNKIKMIDQCIKQGLTKTTDFYKKYKSLRSLKTEKGYEIKDFINDCVFYAKNAQMSKK